jgi:uncharacterized SAM-binding protein YcdF (DUF218 family)
MRNQFMGKRGRLLATLAFGGVLAAFAASAGHILVLDSPQPADVILVLAGETERRPARALQLLQQGYGRRIVLDVPAEAKIYGSSQLELAQTYAQRLPQAAAITICPIAGLSTRDEAHDAERCLQRESGDRVLLVTSDFHTRRALSVFRHELRGHSFSVAAAHEDREFGENWWEHREWAKTCAYEWMRWMWWNAVDRWR